MNVRVVSVKKVEHIKIKAHATIEIEDVGKIAGIKIIQGSKNIYCCPPNQSYVENGLRKWENIITFERSLWKEIQNKILRRYEELKNEHEGEKASQRVLPGSF